MQNLFSALGRISHTDAELVQLAHRWIRWDWFRVSLIAIGFVASIRAISLSATVNGSNQALQPTAGRAMTSSQQHVHEVRLRKDQRGADLISLPNAE